MSEPGLEVGAIVAWVGVGLGALGGAGWLARTIRRTDARSLVPSGARPADGKVHVWPVRAIVGEPLPGSKHWRVATEFVPGPTDLKQSLPTRNLPLLGRVALVSVFVGHDGRSWTDGEIVEGHRALAGAGRWLSREAVRLGAPLTVGLADTCWRVDDLDDAPVAVEFVPEGSDFGPMEANAAFKGMALASRLAARLGCRDVADLVARVNARVEADAHVWLFHLKRAGRSHAIPVGDRLVRGVGIALCFSEEASFPGPLAGPARIDPATVAHELLHLFGATDKYGVALADYPAGTVPGLDIMRLSVDRLDRLRVGPLTAREVGWPTGAATAGATKTPAPRQSQGAGGLGLGTKE